MKQPAVYSPKNFKSVSRRAVKDENLQRILHHALSTGQDKRVAAIGKLPHWESMRQTAHDIRKTVIENLDYYLSIFVSNARAKGIHVYFAEDAKAACEYVAGLARKNRVKNIVKSKSMVTEEIHLNRSLEQSGCRVIETDLGEYVAQLKQEPPSHITAPIIHMSRQDVGRLYEEKLGLPYTDNPAEITVQTRKILREAFLNADMGISGVNFAIADTGSIVIVENEGNIRMVTSIPKIHVAIMGMEKCIPTIDDLPLLLRLLSISAIGQVIPNYVSIIHSPRKPQETDGPEELHIVILDNGRMGILADDEMRQILYCIRCGACLNACPVYARVGGHAYGSVYPGPVGSVLTPLFQGLEAAYDLPFASTLCGCCAEVCPVKIEIHHLLLYLRNRIADRKIPPFHERLGFRLWELMVGSSTLYRFSEQCLRIIWKMFPSLLSRSVPAWSETREFPGLADRSFYRLSRGKPDGTGSDNNEDETRER